MSLLDKDQKEAGAILIDMGDSLTVVSVFLGGVLDSFDMIGVGSRNMRGDFRASAEFGEIVKKVAVKLQDLSKKSDIAPSVTLTGGFALTDGMVEYVEEKLAHPVRMAALKGVYGGISGLDSVRLATAIGLIKNA